MARTIIAGASDSNREQVARLLTSSGFPVHRSCESGSSLRRALAEGDDCVLILLGMLPGVNPDDLVWDYGNRLQILLVAKPSVLEDCESKDIFRLALPTTGRAIITALEMLSQLHGMRAPRRLGTERQIVERAKKILMEQQGLTEPEAHHLLQKYAMDHSVKLVDYAADIVRRAEKS